MTEEIFETAAGRPVTAVTREEMRAVDRVAVEDVGLQLLQMMENAGRNLARGVRQQVGDTAVVVLVGDGGNGGGGLACARHLANHGTTVSVVLDRPTEELTGAAATQHEILAEMDVPLAVGPDAIPTEGAFVDALVGYGLAGPLRGTAAEMVEALPENATTVSLDVPTGRDATTGEEPGPAVDPECVVTLALPKTGLEGLGGRLLLADIAIPQVVYNRVGISYEGIFDGAYLVELDERLG